MVREGEKTLYEPKRPIVIFYNGAIGEVMGQFEGKSDEKDRPQWRFFIRPFTSFSHLYKLHAKDDFRNPSYPNFIEWTCPKMYVYELSRDSAAPALFIMMDYRTRKPMFISKIISQLQEELSNLNSIVANYKRELSKQRIQNKELSQSQAGGFEDTVKESEERIKRYFMEAVTRSKIGTTE